MPAGATMWRDAGAGGAGVLRAACASCAWLARSAWATRPVSSATGDSWVVLQAATAMAASRAVASVVVRACGRCMGGLRGPLQGVNALQAETGLARLRGAQASRIT